VRVNAPHRELSARLHSAGHLLDLAMRDVGAELARAGEAAPSRLTPGKGYHFVDAPSVEYVGALAAPLCERLVPLLNARLAALIAADARTQTWALRRGADDARLAQLLGGEAALAHYAEGKLVRVVAVGGEANTCPCGGTHVDQASRLRGVTVSKVKSAKGVTKVSYSLAA
jgi:Ser-tRNA(Ala) deacylase AlaX